jgi:DNA-(apurinic or apyrimidinic site) lyase
MAAPRARGVIDLSRVEAVAEALSEIPLEAIEALELADPQYRAVKLVAEVYGEKGLVWVIANALVSYRLTSRGEEYWLEFAGRLAEHRPPPDDILGFFQRFLPNSRGNRMLTRQKLNRLQRALPALRRIASSPLDYRDLTRIVRELSVELGSRPYEKTIVFAAKMAYYFFKSLGVEIEGKNVPLPIDARIALISSTSRIVYDSPTRIVARPENAVKAWQMVSEKSSIPTIHLDAVVWLPAAGVDRVVRRDLEKARELFARNLYNYLGRAVGWPAVERVARELLYDYPLS